MNEQGIAWMIAGGARTDMTDQRHYEHLLALREAKRTAAGDRVGPLQRLRIGLAGLVAGSSATSSTIDCCGVA